MWTRLIALVQGFLHSVRRSEEPLKVLDVCILLILLGRISNRQQTLQTILHAISKFTLSLQLLINTFEQTYLLESHWQALLCLCHSLLIEGSKLPFLFHWVMQLYPLFFKHYPAGRISIISALLSSASSVPLKIDSLSATPQLRFLSLPSLLNITAQILQRWFWVNYVKYTATFWPHIGTSWSRLLFSTLILLHFLHNVCICCAEVPPYLQQNQITSTIRSFCFFKNTFRV